MHPMTEAYYARKYGPKRADIDDAIRRDLIELAENDDIIEEGRSR